MSDAMVNVRYMVDDVEAAIAFYTTQFGFTLGSNAAPAFAEIVRGPLRILLSGPRSSAGRAMPDGRRPGPGGWNRIHFIVENIEADVARLRAAGVPFRSDVISGPGGKQIVLDDPSGKSDRALSTREPVVQMVHRSGHGEGRRGSTNAEPEVGFGRSC